LLRLGERLDDRPMGRRQVGAQSKGASGRRPIFSIYRLIFSWPDPLSALAPIVWVRPAAEAKGTSVLRTIFPVGPRRERNDPLKLGFTCLFLVLATALSPALATASAPSLAAQVPDSLRRAGRLVVATDAEFAPCESLAADGRTVIGFDADIWNAVGAKLGLKVTPVPTTFSGIISGVQSGRYPVAISCISDSAERERRALFIDYAYATGAIYTLASNTKITTDGLSLCGLKTAAEAGTDSVDSLNEMSAHCVRRGRPAIAISQFPSANAMFSALVAQRVDFVVNDAVAADAMRAQFPVKLRVIGSDRLPKLYTGMIVQRQAQPLANVLLAALMAIQADGTYGRIMQKWRLGFLQLDTPGLNLATRRPLPEPQP